MMTTTIRWEWWRLTLAVMLISALPVLWGCSADASGEQDSEGEEQEAAEPEDGEASGNGKKDGDKKKDKETPVPVEVASIERGDIEAFLRASANLEAENQVKVFSQAARLVTELHVEEGDRVRKGDILIRLQDDEQRSALAKARNEYEKVGREYEQQKKLFERELISEEVFNNATYQVEQLRISLEDAERDLSYTEVRAPISGTITGRHAQVGDQITVGQHLFDLVDFDSIVARIYVPEKELPRLKLGSSATIEAQGLGIPARTGQVIRVSPVVDPQTGTVKVTIGLQKGHQLLPGMYVDVKLVTDVHRDVALVPKRALVYDQDQIFVYRLGENRRVERLPVSPVLEDKRHVEAPELSAGESIVIAGQAGLKDQALVRLPGDPDPTEEKDEEKDDEEEDDADSRLASEE